MKKGKNNLLKILGIGIVTKLSILIPSGTRIPDVNYNNGEQQNLKEIEYSIDYGKESDFPASYDIYYPKSL